MILGHPVVLINRFAYQETTFNEQNEDLGSPDKHKRITPDGILHVSEKDSYYGGYDIRDGVVHWF